MVWLIYDTVREIWVLLLSTTHILSRRHSCSMTPYNRPIGLFSFSLAFFHIQGSLFGYPSVSFPSTTHILSRRHLCSMTPCNRPIGLFSLSLAFFHIHGSLFLRLYVTLYIHTCIYIYVTWYICIHVTQSDCVTFFVRVYIYVNQSDILRNVN